MKAMRYIFSDGLKEHVVEFTNPAGRLESGDEWAALHHRAHAKAVAENQPGRAVKVEDFESDVPLNRHYFRNA